MPWPTIAGDRLPLNLGARYALPTDRLPLNLGVEEGGGDPPPDPPDPTVIGLVTQASSARWRGEGSRRSLPLVARWGGALHAGRQWRAAWGGLVAQAASSRMEWGVPLQLASSATALWQTSHAALSAATWLPWGAPPQQTGGMTVRWGQGSANARAVLNGLWRSPPLQGRSVDALWRGSMGVHRCSPLVHWTAPPLQYGKWVLPWGRGDGLEWIVRPPPPTPEPPPPGPLRDGRYVGLHLGCPVYTGDTRRLPLNLGITACWMARTQRRAYVVLNEISVVRLPDRLPIHVDQVAIAGGRDAWCWDARLALADPSQLAELAPTVTGPRKVEITLNGYAWVVAIEAFDKADTWGSTDVALSGRSVTAQLAEPYAAPRTRETTQDRTMLQLADAEVAGSEVTADYGTVSWLVPGGAWYYDGLTPMAALQRIAAASGGVVQSHPTDPVVQIRARYPVSPWGWTTTTPDVVIQDDILTGLRLQLQSKPLYDAVIVAGERVGVAARVRRDGEAGQTYAPQQVDPLMTHADGTRERGRNVLSDRGGQASIEHDLPLFGGPLQEGQPGLVLPLMLAQRVAGEGTWHGLVTAVRIEARRQDKAVDIVQTVTIERHYTDAD